MTDSKYEKPESTPRKAPRPRRWKSWTSSSGDGAEATPGAKVDVHYLGVEYDSGEEFDSSWSRGSRSTSR